MIVVDANVISYCFLHTAFTPLAQRVYARDPEWHVPVLWRSEFRNVLCGYLRRNAMSLARLQETLALAERAMAGREHLLAGDAVVQLAAASGLSAYDCEYAALAESLGVPLVTEDRAMIEALPGVAFSMEQFLRMVEPPAMHEIAAPYRRRAVRGRARMRG